MKNRNTYTSQLAVRKFNSRKISSRSSDRHTYQLHRQSKVGCANDSLLAGRNYECLVLEASGSFGKFRRLGYVGFSAYIGSIDDGFTQEQRDQAYAFARGVVFEHFTSIKIPEDVCGTPDTKGLYTITLV